MFDLVVDIPAYPQFLPWCDRAEVLEQSEHSMTARLGLSFSGIKHAFTTRNTHITNQRVVVELVDGPFSLLEGAWDFIPLGRRSGAEPGELSDVGACRVELDLRYAFRSLALEALVSPVFDRIANTLVDSFVKRAESVYGPR
jgi:ribosome-associated toxin RatA of RatAB toxin-antitoxin module